MKINKNRWGNESKIRNIEEQEVSDKKNKELQSGLQSSQMSFINPGKHYDKAEPSEIENSFNKKDKVF